MMFGDTPERGAFWKEVCFYSYYHDYAYFYDISLKIRLEQLNIELDDEKSLVELENLRHEFGTEISLTHTHTHTHTQL